MSIRRHRPSQVEIARLCGVSRSTVSLVLNGSPLVADVTRQRVQSVLEEHGYRPHRMARALVGKNTGLYGAGLVSCSQPAPPYHLAFLEGMLKASTSRGVDLVVRGVAVERDDPTAVESFLTAFLDENYIDGLALVSEPDLTCTDLFPVVEAGVPLVLLNKAAPGSNTPALLVDNKLVMSRAVDYLQSLGHERLLYVQRPTPSRNYEDRLEGFLSTCADRHVRYHTVFDFDQTDNQRSILSFQAFWRSQQVAYTAILCTDTLVALYIQSALSQMGLRVPADVSLFSVGSSTADAQQSDAIGLTRLEIPVHIMGENALELLIRLTNGGEQVPPPAPFVPILVERSSCAALNK